MSEDVFKNPWLKDSEHVRSLPDQAVLPKDTRFVCSYDNDIGVQTVLEAAFLCRTRSRDELWIVNGVVPGDPAEVEPGTGRCNVTLPTGDASIKDIELNVHGAGCAWAVSKERDELSACLALLRNLFQARAGHAWPAEFVASGIINEFRFQWLTGVIERQWADNKEESRKRECQLIQVARKLKLDPQPAGNGPACWKARCPGTHHSVYINASKNSFYCGYCKRKGGSKELREFVRERNSWSGGSM